MRVVRTLRSGELFSSEQIEQVGRPAAGYCDQCRRPLLRYERGDHVTLRVCQSCGLVVSENGEGGLFVQSLGVHRRDGCLMSPPGAAVVTHTRECAKCGKTFCDYYGKEVKEG